MSSLGSLVVSIVANTAQFSSDMGKAAHIAAQNIAKMEKDAARLGKAIAANLAAASTAAAALVQNSINNADATLKMSQSAGTAIEQMSTMQYAASMSGVEADALGSAMVKLTKNMSDASMGTGDSAKGFAALGLKVTDANGKLKSSDVMMKEVAGKFANMEDGANKTALAVNIFGKSGADLIPMLNSGADGISAMQAEAQALGLELDKNTASSAERFNDNIARLGSVMHGFANQVMQAMLPTLEGLSQQLFDSAKSADGLKRAAEVAASGLKLLLSAGAILIGVFKTVGEYMGGVAAAAVALFSGRFVDAFNIAASAGQDFNASLMGTVQSVVGIWDATAAQVEQSAPDTGKKLAAPMIKATEKVTEEQKKQQQLLKKHQQDIEAARNALATYGMTANQTKIYSAAMSGMNEADLIELRTIYEKIDAMDAEAKAAEKVRDAHKKAAEEAAAAYKQFTDATAKQFTDVFLGGMQHGFRGIGDAFSSMVQRMAAEAAAANLTKMLFGTEKGGGMLGSFGAKIAGIMMPSFAGGGSTGDGPRSGGLDGKGGFLALLHPKESVTDHTTGTGGGGGGVSVVQYINIDSRSDAATIIGAVNRAKDMAKAEILDSLTRGGTFAKAVGRA